MELITDPDIKGLGSCKIYKGQHIPNRLYAYLKFPHIEPPGLYKTEFFVYNWGDQFRIDSNFSRILADEQYYNRF